MKNIKNSRKLLAIIFGIYAALGSLPHGIGLMLQGHVKSDSIVLDTWTVGPIAENLGGEPGMTIIPNLWISGLLTIIISLIMIAWIIKYIDKNYGGHVLILLTILVLLTGGGFAPPIISLIAGFSAIGIHKENKWNKKPNSKFGKTLAAIWPYIFGLSVVIGLFVFAIGVILAAVNLINIPEVFVYGFLFLVVSLNYLKSTGPAFDKFKLNIS